MDCLLRKKRPWTVKYVLSANEWISTIHTETKISECLCPETSYQVKRVKAPPGYLAHKGWGSTNLIWLGKPNRSKPIKYRVYWMPLTGLLRDKGETGGGIVIQTTKKLLSSYSHVSRRTSVAQRVERVMVLRWLLLPHWKRSLWRAMMVKWFLGGTGLHLIACQHSGIPQDKPLGAHTEPHTVFHRESRGGNEWCVKEYI